MICIDDWVERAKFVVRPKIDGLSVVLLHHGDCSSKLRGAVMGRSAKTPLPICVWSIQEFHDLRGKVHILR